MTAEVIHFFSNSFQELFNLVADTPSSSGQDRPQFSGLSDGSQPCPSTEAGKPGPQVAPSAPEKGSSAEASASRLREEVAKINAYLNQDLGGGHTRIKLFTIGFIATTISLVAYTYVAGGGYSDAMRATGCNFDLKEVLSNGQVVLEIIRKRNI
jgi:hypothetical protein